LEKLSAKLALIASADAKEPRRAKALASTRSLIAEVAEEVP
jgi:hypothetical protein